MPAANNGVDRIAGVLCIHYEAQRLFRSYGAIRRATERFSPREYRASGSQVAILLRGSAGSGVDMQPLALALQHEGTTTLVLNVRGHLPVLAFPVPANIDATNNIYSWRMYSRDRIFYGYDAATDWFSGSIDPERARDRPESSRALP